MNQAYLKAQLIVVPAGGFRGRLRGLLGRSPLASDTALWLAPCNAVHTFGLGYAIDLLYLDASRQILRQVDSMAANRLSMHWGARSVLELSAGFCRQFPLSRLDYLVSAAFERLDAAITGPPNQAR